jgi:hypothetical protein
MSQYPIDRTPEEPTKPTDHWDDMPDSDMEKVREDLGGQWTERDGEGNHTLDDDALRSHGREKFPPPPVQSSQQIFEPPLVQSHALDGFENLGKDQGSISPITDKEFQGQQLGELGIIERTVFNYSSGWNKTAEAREGDGIVSGMFGPDSLASNLDDTALSWGAMPFTAAGKLLINTNNAIIRLVLDPLGIIDLDQIQAVVPVRDEDGYTSDARELPDSDEVLGQRSHGAQYAEPLAQFVGAMIVSAGAGTAAAPAAAAKLGTWGGFFAAGAAADLTAFDPRHGSAVTALRESGYLPEYISDSWAMEFMDAKQHYENGDEALATVVMALEGSILGETVGGGIKVLGKLWRGFGAVADGSLALGEGVDASKYWNIMEPDSAMRALPSASRGLIVRIKAGLILRAKMYKNAVERGATPSEAQILIEADKRVSLDGLQSKYGVEAFAHIMMDRFGGELDKNIDLVQTFVTRGGDLSTVILDQGQHVSQRTALDILNAGALSKKSEAVVENTVTKVSKAEADHKAGKLKGKSESMAAELGFEVAQGNQRFELADDIHRWLEKQGGTIAKRIIKGKPTKTNKKGSPEYQEFMARTKSHSNAKLRSARVGRPKSLEGAPGYWKGQPYTESSRMEQLVQLEERAKQGAIGRHWYRESGAELLRMSGGDAVKAEQLAAVIAITSPQQEVGRNFHQALQIVEAFNNGQDIRWSGKGLGPKVNGKKTWLNPGLGNRAKVAEQAWGVLSKGDYSNAFGQKTINFYIGLMKHVDPNRVSPEAVYKRFGLTLKDTSTIDLWMMRGGKYASDTPSGKQKVFFEDMLREITDSMNAAVRVGDELYDTDQVQAMIWTSELHDADVIIPWMRKNEARKLKGESPLPEPRMTTFNYADASAARRTNVSLMPSGDIVPGLTSSGSRTTDTFTSNMNEAIRPGGHDPLADAVGLFQPRANAVSQGPGTPVTIEIPSGTQPRTKDPDAVVNTQVMGRVKAYMLGHALLTRPDDTTMFRAFQGRNADVNNAFEFQLDVPYSNGLREEVYNALTAKYGDDSFRIFDVAQSDDGGLRIINFDTQAVPLGKDYVDALTKTISELSEREDTIFKLDVAHVNKHGIPISDRYQAVGERIVYDWAGDPTGSGVLSEIDAARRPAVQALLQDQLGPRVQSVLDDAAGRIQQGDAKPLHIGGPKPVTADSAASERLADGGSLASTADDGIIEGLARFDGDGYTFINATVNSNFQAGVHELGHALKNQLFTGRNTIDNALREQIEEASGVVNGEWLRVNEESFAEQWEAFFLRGETGSDMIESMSYLAASMRDMYRETKKGWPKISPEMANALEQLEYRVDLPIQYFPGKFLQAQDWSQVVQTAKQLNDSGGNWMDAIKHEDLIMRVRAAKKGERTGRDFHFDFAKHEDVALYMAAIQDVQREIHRELVGGKQLDSVRNAKAARVFNAMLGRGVDELPQTFKEMLHAPLITVDQDILVMTGMSALSAQLRQTITLAKKASKSGNVVDEAILTRQYFQFQLLQGYVKRLQNQHGRALRAWGGKTGIPLMSELKNAEGAAKFMSDLGTDMPSAKDLASKLGKLDPNADHATFAKVIKAASEGPLQRALSIFHEVYVNGLLSAPATFATIAGASPAFVMALKGGEKWLGAALWGASRFVTGRSASDQLMIMGEVGENFRRNWSNALKSWQMAGRALMKEESQLMGKRVGIVDRPDTRAVHMQWEDNWLQRGVNHVLGKDADATTGRVAGKAVAAPINVAGRVVRAPTQAIQFLDEGFRQMNARTAIQSKVAGDMYNKLEAEAMESGVLSKNPTHSQRKEFRKTMEGTVQEEVEAQMDNLIRQGHLRTQEFIANEARTTGVVSEEMTKSDGITSGALRPWIGKKISSMPDDLRGLAIYRFIETNYTETHAKLIAHAEDKATEAVFQSEAGPVGKLIQQIVDAPQLLTAPRILMPFVRTPGNILRMWGGYLPTSVLVETLNRASAGTVRRIESRSFGGTWELNPDSHLNNLHSKTMEDLMSGDARKISEARGRQAAGTMILGGAWGLMESGVLTGGGPKDPNLRRQMHDDGWRPYSLHIPGHGYVSFMRLDPIAPSLALVADIIELMESEETKGDHHEKIRLTQALVMTLGSQMSEKTFFQGISDAMKATQSADKAEKFMQRLQMSTGLPFSELALHPETMLFSSLQRNVRDVQDPVIREMRTLYDARAEQSFYHNPEDAPPSRNVLGEARTKWPEETLDRGVILNTLNMINVLRWSDESTDPLYNELARLQHGFAPPGEDYMGLPLAAFSQKDSTIGYKYTAYDRWTELVGTTEISHLIGRELVSCTLRGYLEKWVTEGGTYNAEYQDMAGINPKTNRDNQADFVSGIISQYQQEARSLMLEEYPVLQRLIQDIDNMLDTKALDKVDGIDGPSAHTRNLREIIRMR